LPHSGQIISSKLTLRISEGEMTLPHFGHTVFSEAKTFSKSTFFREGTRRFSHKKKAQRGRLAGQMAFCVLELTRRCQKHTLRGGAPSSLWLLISAKTCPSPDQNAHSSASSIFSILRDPAISPACSARDRVALSLSHQPDLPCHAHARAHGLALG
jgi:hypothetical protein